MKITKYYIFFIAVAIIVGGAYAFVLQKKQKTEPTPAPSSVLTYKSKEFGFTLQYPKEFKIATQNFEGFLRATHYFVVGITIPESFFAGTNLGEAGVFVGVSPNPDSVAACEIVANGEETAIGSVMLGGVPFYAFTAVGVGAGNIYESQVYRTIKNGSCYEIVEMLHSGNISNYPQGAVQQFDKQKFSAPLESIARSFTFTQNSNR